MIDVEIVDDAWTAALADAESVVMLAAEAVLASVGSPPLPNAVIAIALDDDAAVQSLNARFRGKDAPTNVLSFPAPQTTPMHVGDIILAYGVCAREAQAQNKPLSDHLMHLTAHGVLHLLGYDHDCDADAEVMEGLERDILAGLGVPDPYALDETDVPL